MDTAEARKNYYILNKSYKKKLVFYLGYGAGFFSEYNNMILTMLYCLANKIQFVLYSENANFKYQQGWTDYFLPFCDEIKGDFHKKYNYRDYGFPHQQFGRKGKLIIKAYKLLHGVNYLTQDLWFQIRNRDSEKEIYNIPELGIINSSLRDACRKLVNLTWNFNTETDTIIQNTVRSLKLPNEYIGLHIRRGDKFVEQDLIDTPCYLDKAKEISNIRDIFILTDDYNVISEIKKTNKEWNIYTLCKETETGYDHSKFMQENKSTIKDALINLFTSLHILGCSTYFIGTFGSNPGMFLGMKMSPEKAISVDIDWQIW